MKSRYRVCVAVVMLSALFVVAGCETKSSDEATVTVTPSAVQLRVGESQAFTASGATGYQWQLSSGNYGVLSANSGEQVVYTSTASVATTVVITARASLISRGVESNETATATLLEGFASITHVTEMTSGLDVSPGSVTLAVGESQSFEATGGSGSYTWDISDDSLGWLSRASGSVTTYSSTSTNDTQFLTLTSGDETLKIPIYGAE